MDKFGVALALSFAGIIYARVRHKRIRPSDPPAPPDLSPNSEDHSLKVDYGGRLRIKEHPVIDLNSVDSYDKPCIEVHGDSSSERASPNGRYSIGKDGFLLPEFDQLVNELNTSNVSDPDVDGLMIYNVEMDNYEDKIENLKRQVMYLREKERKLEAQLREYYGLKEQETAIMELRNRLKISNVEAKLFLVKIESLQAENTRLASQVVDNSKVVSELEEAKAKIKFLKRMIRVEAQRNKEQIFDLTQRVMKLRDQENEACMSASDGCSLHRMTDLESQMEELRKSNESLKKENDECSRLLESTQFLANSLFEDQEKDDITKEMLDLKLENNNLSKEVERLQADRFNNTEELVYLRWINACLRFELKDYQPPPGKTVARDLSKCLSPKSEKKAKQLILEYSNAEHEDSNKAPSIVDFDFDNWPSSLPSYLTDSTEHDDSPRHKKTNLFAKIRKLIMGKDWSNSVNDHDIKRRCFSESPRSSLSSSEKGNYSSMELIPVLRLDEKDPNKDIEVSVRPFTSGVRFKLGSKSVNSGYPLDYKHEEESEDRVKSELAKYGQVLRDSRMLAKMHKRSVSYSAVLR